MLITGLTLMGTCFMCFGLIDKFESPTAVLYMALFLRFIQGTCVAMIYTTIYAIITNKYPMRKEALLGMLEASFGVGLICGPLAGSSLYNAFGFE
jgi:MFS family permease